jgi:hypothetical protein
MFQSKRRGTPFFARTSLGRILATDFGKARNILMVLNSSEQQQCDSLAESTDVT